MTNYGFVASKNPFCEHCGNLESGSFIKTIDGVNWCIGCANAENVVTNKQAAELLELQRQSIISYAKTRIKELEDGYK